MDFLHKLSTAYVENYDVICVGDLNTEEMREGSRHARNISDSGWATFIQLLSYKAEKAGKTLVKVDPKDTSREGSECGTIVDRRLWHRDHRCPTCGYVADRDYDASRNVLKRGLEKLGEGRAEVTPVDAGTSTLTSVSPSPVVEAGSSVLNEV